MQKPKISVSKLCLENKLEIINKKNIRKDNYIYRPAINRAGLELNGFFNEDSLSKNIIGWGTNESNLMDTFNNDKLEKILTKIFSLSPPLIICSSGVNNRNKNMIIKKATESAIPVVLSEMPLSSITTTISIYLSSIFAKFVQVHASLIIINGVGVMIIGDSGVGKSEAVLDLIHKNHTFVSDDAVIVRRIGNNFLGSSPELTKDILEARGLGLIDVRKIYGEKAIRPSAFIDLVIELKHFSEDDTFDRLGNKNLYYSLLNGKIDMLKIPVRSGRNVSSLIEAAVNLYIARQNNVNALETIQNRSKEEKEVQ